MIITVRDTNHCATSAASGFDIVDRITHHQHTLDINTQAAGTKQQYIGRWFFFNSLYAGHPQLETRFRLYQPIIGIGAPAGRPTRKET